MYSACLYGVPMSIIQPPTTERQQAILEFMQRYLAEHGFPPTLREIGESQGLTNVSAVRGHLAALEKKGYIVKQPDKARSIRLVNSPSLLSRFKKKLHQFAKTDEGVLHQVVYGIGLATRDLKVRFVGPIRTRIEAALDRRAAEHGWEYVRKRIEGDRIVLTVRVWPNHSPIAVASRIRHACEAAIRRERKGLLPPRHLWARGYVVTTNPDQLDALVEQFIEEMRPRTGPG